MLRNKSKIAWLIKIIFNPSYLRRWIITLILAVAALGAGLAVPYVIKFTVDEGISKKNLSLFLVLCMIAAGAMLAKYLLDTVVSLRRQVLIAKIRFDLNRRIFRNMQAMPLSWFARTGAGQAVYAIDNDSAALISFAVAIMDSFLLDALKVMMILGIILALNFKIGLTIILISPLLGLSVLWQTKKLNALYAERAITGEAVFNLLEESFWRSYLIKVFNALGQVARRYTRLLIKDTRLIIESGRQETIKTLIPAVLPMVVTGAVFVLSGYQAIKGNLSLGALAAIGGYIYQCISASSQLLSQWHNLQPGLIAAERLLPLLKQDKTEALITGEKVNIAGGAIKVHQVHFSYDNGPAVLKGINADIPAADYTVITGPSGCGKTTLFNLIMGLYPLKSGEILIDGKNIDLLLPFLLGKEIIICPQEPMLWNASIVENIIYPETYLDWEAIKQAVQVSGADEFVAQMEKGYETIIGENACRLSQGQKQRISLARALVKQPKILLLDEAFSGLPEADEANIIARIRAQFKATTVVAVTHRLSSLKDCASIIRLNA